MASHTKIDNACLIKAKDDEPIFVLRAQDMTSPTVIKMWLRLNPELSMDKYADAIECIQQMENWPKRKMAD